MVPFGVIADDFTGASDVGVQFKKEGLETVVLTDVRSLKQIKNFDVAVIDTESRNITSTAAYNKVKKVVRSLKALGVKIVYKKIDSTLRGNIGAELDAVLDELGLRAAILSPAFPATGRTTVNGRQLVKGVPLAETEFAHDPIHPIKESHIATLIEPQTERGIAEINLPKVTEGTESLKLEIKSKVQAGAEVIVVDAETPADLKAIAKAAIDLNVLSCGSAGLAEGISYWLSSALQKGGCLVVSGSVNSVTLNQIQEAEKSMNVTVLEPDLVRILRSINDFEAEVGRLVDESLRTFSQGKDAIIRLAASKKDLSHALKFGAELGMDESETGKTILSLLGRICRKVLEEQGIGGLILVGGDTAIEVIKSLDARGIRIEGEFLPGIPLARLVGGRFEGLPIVTKAGGFGSEDALIISMKKLRRYSLSLGPRPSTM